MERQRFGWCAVHHQRAGVAPLTAASKSGLHPGAWRTTPPGVLGSHNCSVADQRILRASSKRAKIHRSSARSFSAAGSSDHGVSGGRWSRRPRRWGRSSRRRSMPSWNSATPLALVARVTQACAYLGVGDLDHDPVARQHTRRLGFGDTACRHRIAAATMLSPSNSTRADRSIPATVRMPRAAVAGFLRVALVAQNTGSTSCCGSRSSPVRNPRIAARASPAPALLQHAHRRHDHAGLPPRAAPAIGA